uniref:epithelial cell-transforming sequence 2 oncogene-like n=1 Tax=Myxine glutinosa TaxID=7769 RepID=UPI00358F36E7
MKQAWFLPYSPCDTEFGAWKRHYIQCVTSLDWTRPPQEHRGNPQRAQSVALDKKRSRARRRWLKRHSTIWKRQQEDVVCSRSAIVPCHVLDISDGALRCPSDVSREVNQRNLGGSTELMDTVCATRRKLAHSPCMCKAVGCPALSTTQGLPETIQAGLSCCRPAEQPLLVLISSAVPAPEV